MQSPHPLAPSIFTGLSVCDWLCWIPKPHCVTSYFNRYSRWSVAIIRHLNWHFSATWIDSLLRRYEFADLMHSKGVKGVTSLKFVQSGNTGVMFNKIHIVERRKYLSILWPSINIGLSKQFSVCNIMGKGVTFDMRWLWLRIKPKSFGLFAFKYIHLKFYIFQCFFK